MCIRDRVDLLKNPTSEATRKAGTLYKRFLKMREAYGDTLAIEL